MTLRRMLGISSAVLLPLVFTGCAGLKSTKTDASNLEGVAYYMPMRAFILKVTTVGGAVTTLTWEVSPSLPDLRQAYSLNFDPHWIGKTTIDVAVGPSGLLGSANTSTTSSIAEIAKMQSAAAAAKAKMLASQEECPTDDTFVFYILAPTKDGVVCKKGDGNAVQYRIDALQLLGAEDSKTAKSARPLHVPAEGSVQGVFYRMERPYTASAWSTTGANKAISQLATSLLSVPNESPTMYLPFGRTLFAANDAKVTFTEGVLSKYAQADEGELVAFLQFPATILGAYFSAVGNIFGAFSTRDVKDAQLRLQQLKLDIFADQLAKCKAALDKGDSAALTALACDKLSVPP